MGKMTPITIDLPEQAQAYINEQLTRGVYATVDELMTALILTEKMRQEEPRLDASREKSGDWLSRLKGSISNDELFLEALEYGRSVRMSDSF
jgi:Arc/MetJ-type ribon-helix-helix transcriptional regulator